jgi:hypothetical protein
MKKLTLSLLAAALISAAGSVSAWWGNGWGGWNPYDPWDPRYWLEEFFGGGWGYGGPWGYGGYPYYGGYYGGPWGHGGPWGYGGYPYHGGGYWPAHAGWGHAPYAVLPPQTQGKAKSEKAS